MLSRAEASIRAAGLEAQVELLEDVVDDEEELTKCVVSVDCGLNIRGTKEVEAVPLTGEPPDVNPSSAELE